MQDSADSGVVKRSPDEVHLLLLETDPCGIVSAINKSL